MNSVILKKVTAIILPFIILYGFYILLHGEISPGGGFQGGSIWATALAVYAMVFSPEAALKAFPLYILRFIACLGCMIYALLGFIPVFMGGRFLDYSVLYYDNHIAQSAGIIGIEIGVQLTVFGVLSLIFLKLISAGKN